MCHIRCHMLGAVLNNIDSRIQTQQLSFQLSSSVFSSAGGYFVVSLIDTVHHIIAPYSFFFTPWFRAGGHITYSVPPSQQVVSIHRHLLPFSPTLNPAFSRSLLIMSLHLYFGVPLLFLPPSLSISLHSFPVCVLPIAVCSPLPSSSGVSLFRSRLLISPSSFCLVSLYIFSKPSCSLLPAASPVSLLVQVFPTLCIVIVIFL